MAQVLYRRLRRRGRRLSVRTYPGATPYEFAGRMDEAVRRRSAEGLLKRLQRPAVDALWQVVEYYVLVMYARSGTGSVSVEDRRAAIRAWRRLSWRLWLIGTGGRSLAKRSKK